MRHGLMALGLAATVAGPAGAYDGLVEKQSFTYPGAFTTVGGATIAQVKVGYETLGKLDAAGSNAILIPHFFSGTSHFAGRYKADDKAPGYWDALVGPGKPLDTDKYFLISVDSLCNINVKDGIAVTTGPASIDPGTGKPYGSHFPEVQIRDFVTVQKALLDKLGVKKLHAVMGASMGSMQSYEWAASYPSMVERLIAVIPSAQADAYTIERVRHWGDIVKLDPNWKHGDYYGGPEPLDGLTMAFKVLSLDTLAPEWGAAQFGRKWADPAKDPAKSPDNLYAVETGADAAALSRAKAADAGNFVCLVRANELFTVGGKDDLAEGLKTVKAKTLLLPSHNDHLLFADATRHVRDLLDAQGTKVEYHELDGPLGHVNGVVGMGQAAAIVQKFLAE
ncbi:E22 family MetX-like putative esterase [Aliidongia dinghuensis]|nr:homoserine O-acetyltransferase [Aliidongia dinghuensis]